MPSEKKAWVWIWLSLLIIVIDQFSKYLVVKHLSYGQPYALTSFFNLLLSYNPGAAFSFLGGAGGWQIILFSGLSIIVSLILIVWLGRIRRNDWLMAMALSLILGGAVGNLIDRLRLRYVIDFFDFHIGNWHFATFNVADAAVTVGACFLIIRLVFCRD